MRSEETGRNDPCPCGSGKKHKKCCGSMISQQNEQMTDPRTMSTSVPTMGVPGEPQGLVTVNVFREATDPRNSGGPAGVPGQYKVTFLFERPGYRQTKEYEFSFLGPLRGDSHLAMTKPAFVPPGNPDADQVRISARTPHGAFEFTALPNEKGFFGKVVSEPFQANDRNDAERKAYDALAPALSNWSVHLDIPLEAHLIETIELRTENVGIRVVQPFLEAPFSVQGTPPPHDSESQILADRELPLGSVLAYVSNSEPTAMPGGSSQGRRGSEEITSRSSHKNSSTPCRTDSLATRTARRATRRSTKISRLEGTSSAWDAAGISQRRGAEGRADSGSPTISVGINSARARSPHQENRWSLSISRCCVCMKPVQRHWLSFLR